MSTDNKLFTVPFEAGADLSGKQFYAVKLNSSKQVVLVTAITDIVLGILQNTPDAQGKEASVCLEGISKFVFGATLVPGVLAGVDSDGKGAADATTNFTMGLVIDGGVDGDIGSIHLSRSTVK